jgi:hypothetical protein
MFKVLKFEMQSYFVEKADCFIKHKEAQRSYGEEYKSCHSCHRFISSIILMA